MVFGASNEPPQEEELWALFDRFPVRVLCLPVDDTYENLKTLQHLALGQACDSLWSKDKRSKDSKQWATVNHFRMLHRILHKCYGGRTPDDEFLHAYCDTFRALKREFRISDRSFFLLYRAARALGLMRGRESLQADELDIFKFCFRDPEAAPSLAEAVEDRKRRYGPFHGSHPVAPVRGA